MGLMGPNKKFAVGVSSGQPACNDGTPAVADDGHRPSQLFFTSATKTAIASIGRVKIGDDVEFNLQHRYHDHLRNALHRLNRELNVPAIPDRDKYLSLIVGVNQPDEIAQHDAVFMAQSGARQDHCCNGRIVEVNRDP